MITTNPKNLPPTAQRAPGDAGSKGDGDWLKRAQDAYRDSTSYVDTNYRKAWDDSLRAFNNEHPGDSKYNTAAFEKRSKLYRPKLRSIMRKNEAAAAAAFFSNMETTDVKPGDQTNKTEAASAQMMKELLQYRLTKTIPWFQILLGGLQDAQAMGASCAHVYWEFEQGSPDEEDESESEAPEEDDAPTPMAQQESLDAAQDPLEPPSQDEYKDFPPEQSAEVTPPPKPVVDRPVVDLFPLENLRIDSGASWLDPINSSPYLIHLIPMYVMDVKDKMAAKKWRYHGEDIIRQAMTATPDSTRSARGRNIEDRYAPDAKSLSDYEIVWVQRHIHRRKGKDWEFYTLGDTCLLTTPRPLKEAVFHGRRPYVLGVCIIETHRAIPSSLPTLGKGLADEANEIANQRIDNVKFVLNKKWFVKRGRDVDVAGLMKNTPGGAVLMDDPINDVRELTWPDVTQSAYEEQGRIDNDMNDLLGNFSAGQVMADKGIQGPARNMQILQQSTGTLVELLLRTYVETFVQPVLQQVMLLEQHYETDQTILALVGKRAELWQKFNIDKITDEMLEQQLTLTVNVGMGATDPQMKLQKFLAATSEFAKLMQQPIPGLNLKEVGGEIYGHLGYADGSRFFTNEDPNVAMLQNEMQKQAKVIQELNAKLAEKQSVHAVKKEVAQIQGETMIKKTMLQEEGKSSRDAITHLRAIREQDKGMAHEAVMQGISHVHSMREAAHAAMVTPKPEPTVVGSRAGATNG